jgi:hypothetical protein
LRADAGFECFDPRIAQTCNAAWYGAEMVGHGASMYNWDKYNAQYAILHRSLRCLGCGAMPRSADSPPLCRYYLNGALCGGLCCSVTHGGMCPVDVVKTRIQLDPVKYNKGLIGGFRQIIQSEGAGAPPHAPTATSTRWQHAYARLDNCLADSTEQAFGRR